MLDFVIPDLASISIDSEREPARVRQSGMSKVPRTTAMMAIAVLSPPVQPGSSHYEEWLTSRRRPFLCPDSRTLAYWQTWSHGLERDPPGRRLPHSVCNHRLHPQHFCINRTLLSQG